MEFRADLKNSRNAFVLASVLPFPGILAVSSALMSMLNCLTMATEYLSSSIEVMIIGEIPVFVDFFNRSS